MIHVRNPQAAFRNRRNVVRIDQYRHTSKRIVTHDRPDPTTPAPAGCLPFPRCSTGATSSSKSSAVQRFFNLQQAVIAPLVKTALGE